MGTLTIIFSKTTSTLWEENANENFLELSSLSTYLRSLSILKGYIYKNVIFDTYGIEWDPKLDNICYSSIEIDITECKDNEFQITIRYKEYKKGE